jgi:hypothetical protein
MVGVDPMKLRGWFTCGLYGITIAVGIWIAVSAVVNAPAARAMVELQRASEIAQENLTMCAEIGMSFRTPQFGRCISVLMRVRQRHEERLMRDFDVMGPGPERQ